jgi:hypothetical protein
MIYCSVYTDMHLSQIIQWLTFQQFGKFVNLSRIDPSLLTVTDGHSMNRSFVSLPGQTPGYCIATSLIYVHECALINGKQHKDTRVKKVGGVLHSQEIDRLMGCTGMLFDFKSVAANMFGWVMYFETKKEDFHSQPGTYFFQLMKTD